MRQNKINDMEYDFRAIEQKWQRRWAEQKTYRVEVDKSRPKYYVLDMFPYPSGAGLHVGHPLGYIASDIYSRYKRLRGFNVLHPMGYDAFGLPAEQYAIQTGQHPAVTTEKNINRYREQLDKIGFSFDWDREVRTCYPEYYKWTQWAFLKMFDSYYCNDEQQARPIAELVAAFEQGGTDGLNVACTKELAFTAAEWNAMGEAEKENVLQNYRLAFRADTLVNWCPGLGTVLANDEVKDGLSVRGGFPVEQKLMKQWLLRVTAYAQRMLDGLDSLEWSVGDNAVDRIAFECAAFIRCQRDIVSECGFLAHRFNVLHCQRNGLCCLGFLLQSFQLLFLLFRGRLGILQTLFCLCHLSGHSF